MGREPGHDDTLLIRTEMVSRDNAANNRTTQVIQTFGVASVEWLGRQSETLWKHPVYCWEDHVTVCV